MNHSKFLREIDIFSKLSDQEREKICAAIREETFPEGTFIFHKESVGDKIYIVKAGTVEIRKRVGESPRVTRIAWLKQGEVFVKPGFFSMAQPEADLPENSAQNFDQQSLVLIHELIEIGLADAEQLCVSRPGGDGIRGMELFIEEGQFSKQSAQAGKALKNNNSLFGT